MTTKCDNLEAKKSELGKILRLLRISKDLSIKQLASMMSVSSAYISEIENGVKRPSLKMITKYSDVLDVSKSTIMYFDERGEILDYDYQNLLYEMLKAMLGK